MPEESPTVVLGRAGVRTGWALLLAMALVCTVFVALDAYYALTYPVLTGGACAWFLFVRSGDVVLLQPDALVVVTRGGRRSFPWDDVLEVAWRRDGQFLVGPGPVLRVRGGAYDQPGPNMAAQVAALPIFSRRASEAAEAALSAAALRHGVRFDPHMERDIAMGRRRPQLPGEGQAQQPPH